MFERSSIGTISEIYDSTEPYEERTFTSFGAWQKYLEIVFKIKR